MTKKQQILTRQSEIRQKLNDLLGVDDRTDEQNAELGTLTAEMQTLEPELRAAIAAEPPAVETVVADGLDPEVRERIELRGRVSFARMLFGLVRGRPVSDGAEHEYRESLGVGDDEIPLDIFESDRPAPVREERALTPAPTSGVGVGVAPVQPYVFSPSIAPRLGIDMPSVASGGYSEMTITTALPAAPKAKGGNAAGTAGALTAVTATPRRISARMTVAIEDVASVGVANFESALRQNVSASLSDAYDDQCINGNGTAPNVEGLIKQLTDPMNPTAVAAFDDWVEAFADQIDGLWATMVSEVAIVANVDAYKLAAKSFRGAATAGAPNQTAADYLRAATAGFWTNSRMPSTPSSGANSNIARGIVHRMGRAGLRTASHPTWGTLGIDDQFTDSASGQRHFTLHTLVGSKVLLVQPDAYDLVEFKVA